MLRRLLLPAFGLVVQLAKAQVTTDCNPMEKDCPNDDAFGTLHTFNMSEPINNDLWETMNQGSIDYDPQQGAIFTIAQQGDSPTLRTKFYFFGGTTELIMKTAPGVGIVSSMMWLSDDLDEVDWEMLGVNNTHASTNYFGKGNQVYTNGKEVPCNAPQEDYHNYTTNWTKDKIEWWIDGQLMRTLTADQANKTRNFPQTPMRMSIGIWAGGDPSLPKGTREWAGGTTDYDNGPYHMYIKSVRVEDASKGTAYSWGDRSGSWDSIAIIDQGKNSSAVDAINKPPPKPAKPLSQKWAEMSPGAKAGIYAGAGTAGAILAALLIFYCIRQRRRGDQERKEAEAKFEAERQEDERFRREGRDPDALVPHGSEYGSHDNSMANVVTAMSEKNGNMHGAGVAAGAAVGMAATTSRPFVNHSRPTTPRGPNDPFSDSRHASPAPSSRGGGRDPFSDTRSIASTSSNRVGGGGPRSPPSMPNLPSPAPSAQHGGGPPPQGRTMSPMNSMSPGGYGGPGGPGSPMMRSNSPLMRTQSPSMPPQSALPPTPYNQMRMESPGPATGQGYRGW